MLTYSIVSDGTGLDYKYLQRILRENGWEEIPVNNLYKHPNPFVDLLWIDAETVVKDVWKIKCTMKNLYDNDKIVITNKCKLYENLANFFPEITKKHVPETFKLKNLNHIQDGKVYIVRPCGRNFYSGEGIYIITNNDELQKVKQIYSSEFIAKRKEFVQKKNQEFDVIVSEYITNTSLLNGYKFHLRMYLLINTFPKYSHKLWKIGKIITAREKYASENYANKLIHDTHMKSTPKNIFFPENLDGFSEKDKKYMFQQMEEITTAIAEIYKRYAKPYPESKAAFEVFGLDFMIDDKLTVKIIELNDRVGYAPAQGNADKEFKLFSKRYYKWAYKYAIKPIVENMKQ